MPSVDRLPVPERPLYSIEELIAHGRNILRYAQSFRPGSERNQHRQIAFSLGRFFKDKQQFASTLAG
jgi:hypothetical protein